MVDDRIVLAVIVSKQCVHADIFDVGIRQRGIVDQRLPVDFHIQHGCYRGDTVDTRAQLRNRMQRILGADLFELDAAVTRTQRDLAVYDIKASAFGGVDLQQDLA